MPKPIDRSSPAVSPLENPAETASTEQAAKAEADHVAEFATPAAKDAMGHIDESWGWGLAPDMKSIDAELGKLEGFDLLTTLHHLEDKGTLEPMLNQLSPDERQHLINQLVKGNVVERDSDNKLKSNFTLPKSLHGMLSELDAMCAREKRTGETRFNWTAAHENAVEGLERTMKHQVRTLKPGDSVTLDVKAGIFGATLTGNQESEIGITRAADGTFRLHGEVGGELGVHAHADGYAAEVRAEAGAGGSVRVEYSYRTAEEAIAAAGKLTSPTAMSELGKPVAIELKGKAGADLIGHLGPEAAKAFHVALKAEGELSLRVELDKKHPELVLKASAKASGEVGLMFGREHWEAELHGHEAKAEGKLELEARIPIEEPYALLGAPVDYLKQNGAKLAAAAEYKATISEEASVGHHGKSAELTVSGHGEDVFGFVNGVAGTRPWKTALMGLSRSVEVDLREKDFELKHVGISGKVHVGVGGAEGELGLERKAVEKERVLFKGSAYELVSGSPRRAAAEP